MCISKMNSIYKFQTIWGWAEGKESPYPAEDSHGGREHEKKNPAPAIFVYKSRAGEGFGKSVGFMVLGIFLRFCPSSVCSLMSNFSHGFVAYSNMYFKEVKVIAGTNILLFFFQE